MIYMLCIELDRSLPLDRTSHGFSRNQPSTPITKPARNNPEIVNKPPFELELVLVLHKCVYCALYMVQL